MGVIGLTGFAQSGKDTAAGFIAEFGYQRLAFADILRQSLYNLNPMVRVAEWRDALDRRNRKTYRVQELVDEYGWDVVKVEYPEVRALLQRFGTEVGRDLYGESFWVDRVMNQIKTNPHHDSTTGLFVGHEVVGDYVITDVRFPNELDAVRRVGGQVWRIQRPGVGAVNDHISEQVLPHDLIVPNTGDLVAFRRNVLDAAGLDVD